MNIGILTFHIAQNYGAFLQAYALQYMLNNMGHDTKIIDYRPKYLTTPYNTHTVFPSWTKSKNILRYSLSIPLWIYLYWFNYAPRQNRQRYFSESMKRLPLSNKTYYSYQDLSEDSFEYDKYIAGSDQIWNPILAGNKLDPAYFFTFIDDVNRVSTYAASMTQGPISNIHLSDFKKYLSSVGRISVREISNVQYLESLCHKTVINVADPTLLMTQDDWNKIAIRPKSPPKNFVLYYDFTNNPTIKALAHHISKKMNLPIVCISRSLMKFNYLSRETYVRPEEFVWYFNHASFIVTNSFHGTMFSIINKKPFYVIASYPTNIRIVDHLSLLGLLDRVYDSGDEVKEINCDIDYDAVYKKLDILRQKSLDYLHEITIENTS